MKAIFVYALLLLLFMSCNSTRDNLLKEVEDKDLTLLEFDYCSKKNLPHDFDSVSFIPLETTEESLISSITKILYKDSTYYIFDKIQAMIFLFDAKGIFINKIHNIGSGPGEYADISDFDLDANLNIYISSIVGRKIVKYDYPDYKSFTEYKTNASVMEIAIDEESGKIWASNIFKTEDGVCLGFYEKDGFIPVISYRGISDNANTAFKAHSFYKSDNCLFFNPRYSPYIYIIKDNKVCKYMKITSGNFINDSDLELENEFRKKKGIRTQYNAEKCLVNGVNSFYICNGRILAEIWRNQGAPLLLEYDEKNKRGSLFCPLLDEKIKVYTKVAAVSSSFYISYIDAQSFINNYKDTIISNYKLNDESNPILMNLYLK